MKILKTTFCALIGILFLSACNKETIPEKATAVENFEVEKYLGKWYEIARIDFKFEEGLNNTTAEYSILDDGKVGVLNKGYDYEKEKWTESEGKARFIGDETVAKLEVSFFGPFYSGYNVIALEGDYQYALVAGESLDYLWILSREKTIPESIKQQFLEKAQAIGYDTSKLIWVEHDM